MPRISRDAADVLQLVANKHPAEVVARLVPPSELTKEQREEWLRVVDTMPADWFVPGNAAALAQYCRHVVMARRLAERREAAMSDEDASGNVIAGMVRAQQAEIPNDRAPDAVIAYDAAGSAAFPHFTKVTTPSDAAEALGILGTSGPRWACSPLAMAAWRTWL